ncbi:MAG: LytTR family DNA-binding domain-containing protein, partial [Lachnospiraceae bacterium]|nr:LytTR family DNA-binding domain-containing protein [Lachnospiraceae bacterium]
MYNIALCDDEQDFADEMKQYIQRYQEESGEEIRVMVFRNGLELIENYDPSTDLIFLDIQMDQMDGLETAKRIREKDEEAGIIFLTSLKQYALEGYQYQAVNYLIKPMKYIRLKTELDRWIEKCRKKNPCIV